MKDLLQRTRVPSLHQSTLCIHQLGTPEISRGLTQIISSHPFSSCIHVVQLNVESEESITHAVFYIKDLTNKRIDILLKVTIILGNRKNIPGPERSLPRLQRSWMKKIMVVNAIRPLLFFSSPSPPSKPGAGEEEGGRKSLSLYLTSLPWLRMSV